MRGLADIAAFFLAMGITWAATPWVTRLALKANVLAVPRSRDVHETPPPRWGGIAIYLGRSEALPGRQADRQ